MFLVCLLYQFCNISGVEHLNLDNPALTSTPMCGQRCLFNTPLQKETTPKHQKENDMSVETIIVHHIFICRVGFVKLTTFRKSSLRTPKLRKTVTIPTPRTPTPFKNALAAQEKMHGPLKMEVSVKVLLSLAKW